jgi:S1-C subfamily serine protease
MRTSVILTVILMLSPALQAGGIPAKTIKELKAATVYIKVQFRDNLGPLAATGSGFVVHVDGETGYVVTNYHVVEPGPGAVREGNPKLVFNSATPKEKTVDAVIVAGDAVRDLAVLKVSGVKELPRPIKMDPEFEVAETMTVYSLGFPFGKRLALDNGNNPAINITRGTVTSLRPDYKGDVHLVQIDAEINPGNSGGPIVDDKGNLVGVAVSKIIEARTVGFAIPVKPLWEIMQGKLARVVFDPMQVDKDKAKVRVQAPLLDPLAKVSNLTVYYRLLPPGPRGDALDLPKPEKDGRVPIMKDAAKLNLKVESGRGVADFYVERGQGEKLNLVYQASYSNGTGRTITTPATITYLLFPKIIINDTLTRADPIDKARGQPAKHFVQKMQAGKHYVIEMRGDPKEIDPWLILRDSAGKVLAEDDDSGGYPNALIVFAPAKDDDYKISATVFKADTLGPFSLRIREETGREIGNSGYNKAGKLTAFDASDPMIGAPAKTFNFIVKKNRPYTIDVKSKEFDPYVRLENMAGVNVRNEDLGGEGHSTLFFIPTDDTVFRVVVTSFDRRTGAFEMKVTPGPIPKEYEIARDGLKIADALTMADSLDLELGKLTNFRCKVYLMKMKANQRYQFELSSADFDTVLRIEDVRGRELAFHRDMTGNNKARILFTAPADGAYRVIVSHFDQRMGKYNLEVRGQ